MHNSNICTCAKGTVGFLRRTRSSCPLDVKEAALFWPTLFLLNVCTAVKGTHFYSLLVVTAAGVVPCGINKKRRRASSIVQFIFFLHLVL